jgi:hypothetical protein
MNSSKLYHIQSLNVEGKMFLNFNICIDTWISPDAKIHKLNMS